jgi:transglutaminase-like putative cysteine protease
MKLQSLHLADYLKCMPIIDWETPAIIEQTQAIIRSLTRDTAKARALFEWVRDAVPHSWDIGTDVVTCAASEVLPQRNGLCYAKSHLLAAMLRSTGIPAGFCYQGEFLYETIYTDPAPEVVVVLRGFTSLRALWPYLPAPFAEDMGASSTKSEARSVVCAAPGEQG